MTTHPLPPPLSDSQLALRKSLPLKPDARPLQGRFIRLEPTVIARDAEPLYAICTGAAIEQPGLSWPAYDADELIWRWMPAGPFVDLDDFVGYLSRQVDAPNGLPYTAFDREHDQPVGMINLMSNSPNDLKIELGSIWYTPPVQRTPVNTEATYLCLRHCFGLGYRRLEWKCNALNERSRRAALRLGFQFEGIQEGHMIIKDRNRDTAWFRILEAEWPDVQRRLETMLYGNC